MKKTTTPAPSEWRIYEIVLRRKVEGKFETLNLPATEATIPRYLESGAIEDLLPPDGGNLAAASMRNAIKRMVNEAHARADAREVKRIVKLKEKKKQKSDAPHWSDEWLAAAYARDQALGADALVTAAREVARFNLGNGNTHRITQYRARKFLEKKAAGSK